MTLVSPCCGVTVRVCLQIETNWYECTKCGKPCDPVSVKSVSSRKRDSGLSSSRLVADTAPSQACDPVEKKSDEPTASKDR